MRWMVCLLVCACGSVSEKQPDAKQPDGAGSGADSTPPPCDVTKRFGSLMPLGGVNTNSADYWGWLSQDQLTLYFASFPTGSADISVYRATRAQPSGAFSGVMVLPGVSTTAYRENRPVVTADGLTLIAETNAGGTYDIAIATRTSTAVDFSGLTALSVVNSTTVDDEQPWISDDGLTLYFLSDRSGMGDIYRSTRPNLSTSFATPEPVEVNSPTASDLAPTLSKDGLELFFGSNRNATTYHTWHATRTTTTDGFGTPTMVSELVDGTNEDFPNWLSPDRCTMIFTSTRAGGGGGGYDMWMATRPQ